MKRTHRVKGSSRLGPLRLFRRATITRCGIVRRCLYLQIVTRHKSSSRWISRSCVTRNHAHRGRLGGIPVESFAFTSGMNIQTAGAVRGCMRRGIIFVPHASDVSSGSRATDPFYDRSPNVKRRGQQIKRASSRSRIHGWNGSKIAIFIETLYKPGRAIGYQFLIVCDSNVYLELLVTPCERKK